MPDGTWQEKVIWTIHSVHPDPEQAARVVNEQNSAESGFLARSRLVNEKELFRIFPPPPFQQE
jgi:hypothetical protein